jgi:hypothetical protein
MSFKLIGMQDLTENGLSLRASYQKHFLYTPQPSSVLINQIELLETEYLKSKEIKEASGKRKQMLDFLMLITKAIKNSDDKKDETFGSLWRKFWGTDSKESLQKAEEEEKLKSWVLTGAIIFIRYKISMEYEPGITNPWGFFSAASSDPNSSTLYEKLGDILCPKQNPLYKPLYDVKTMSHGVNHFAMVNALSGINDFLSNMDPKPKYLTEKGYREGQLEEYLKKFTQDPAYRALIRHQDKLEQQEKVVASLNNVFKLASTEIEKLGKKPFKSLNDLENAVSGLTCHASVKTLLDWSVGLMKNRKSLNVEDFNDQLSKMTTYIAKNAIFGAQILFRASFATQSSEENAALKSILDDAIGNTKTNTLNFADPEDIEIIKSGLNAYSSLAKLVADPEVHKALWGELSLESVVKDVITNVDSLSNKSPILV